MTDRYDLDEHRYRFATWAAMLAAKRQLGGGSLKKFRAAFEGANARDEIGKCAKREVTAREFDELHDGWCRRMERAYNQLPTESPHIFKRPTTIRFGRAAKYINVYIKCAYIIHDAASTASFKRFAHPPIDREVLSGARYPFDRAWTSWTATDYAKAMAFLRQRLGPDEGLWMIERHWGAG